MVNGFEVVLDDNGLARTVFEDGSYCYGWTPRENGPIAVAADESAIDDFRILVDEDGRKRTVFDDGSYCFDWVPQSA